MESAIKNVLRRMRIGKLVRPDDLPIEGWMCVVGRELYG